MIAAKLNVANQSSPAPINGSLADADGLLEGFDGILPYNVKTSSTRGTQMGYDANVLESYNADQVTPGCTL